MLPSTPGRLTAGAKSPAIAQPLLITLAQETQIVDDEAATIGGRHHNLIHIVENTVVQLEEAFLLVADTGLPGHNAAREILKDIH